MVPPTVLLLCLSSNMHGCLMFLSDFFKEADSRRLVLIAPDREKINLKLFGVGEHGRRIFFPSENVIFGKLPWI